MGMNLRVRDREEGSASGWIEKGMMGRQADNHEYAAGPFIPCRTSFKWFYILVTLYFTTSFVSLASSFSSCTTVVSLFD